MSSRFVLILLSILLCEGLHTPYASKLRKPHESLRNGLRREMVAGTASIDITAGIRIHARNIEPNFLTKLNENLQWLVTAKLSRTVSRLLLVGCAMTYGYGYVNTKVLQQILEPSIVTTLRFMLASLVFLPSVISNWKYSNTEALKGGMELGALCAIGFISQGISLQSTSASKVAFFCGLSVIMPPIFSIISSALNGTQVQKPPPASTTNKSNYSRLSTIATSPLIPPCFALLGACILEWGSFDAPHIRDLLLLITPISFSLCFWRAERLARKIPNSTVFVTGIMLSTCAMISGLSAVWAGAVPRSVAQLAMVGKALWSKTAVSSLIYQGLLATAATSYIEQRAILTLSAADTTLIYALEPIFASLFASLFLHEHLGPMNYISAGLIISACLYDTIVAAVLKKSQ